MPQSDIINCTLFWSVSRLSAALHYVNEAKALGCFKPGNLSYVLNKNGPVI